MVVLFFFIFFGIQAQQQSQRIHEFLENVKISTYEFKNPTVCNFVNTGNLLQTLTYIVARF